MNNAESPSEIDLTEEQIDDLMVQYVEKMEYSYEEFLPSIWIASCEIFGVECKDNNIAYVYAYVLDEEYVKFKNKAYVQSGGYGPVKIKVDLSNDNIKYLSEDIPEDGDDYEDKLKELFPEKYYSMYKNYNPYDENDEPRLKKYQKEKIKEIWGIDISEEYVLQIDEDGSYKLVKLIDQSAQDEFDYKIVESGKFLLD
jgi:hypothetical protein